MRSNYHFISAITSAVPRSTVALVFGTFLDGKASKNHTSQICRNWAMLVLRFWNATAVCNSSAGKTFGIHNDLSAAVTLTIPCVIAILQQCALGYNR